MSKEDLIIIVNDVDRTLESLNTDLVKSEIKFITKKQTQQEVQSVAKKWFEEIEPVIQQFGIAESTNTKYHNLFSQLLQLSLKTSWKKTYQRIIQEIMANFKEDVTINIMKSAGKITSIANFTKISENVTAEEKEYLNEALGCAKYGFYRASMVTVWSAAINRMQKIIEKLGLTEFNKKSEEMKVICEGRFKRFKKSFNVHSLSELRATVFDTDLLWVLEYWGLIDANQHDRLGICFTMRNNAAHPGEAIITEPNLASAFSDLKTIVFDNPRFKLE
jgi:hypothetical protein